MNDYNFINHFQMGSLEFNSVDIFPTQQYFVNSLGETFQESLSSESYSTNIEISQNFERPTKLIKTNSWNSSTIDHFSPNATSSSSSHLISFVNSGAKSCGNLNSSVEPKDEVVSNEDMSLPSYGSYDMKNYANKGGQGTKKGSTMTRTSSHAHDHIMAERKRRERLAERIIALSAIVPGLKKMDKASVLGDAIKYLKQLQERVKVLEEQANKKSEESVVFVNKSQFCADDDSSSGDEKSGGCFNKELPEIEARVSGKNVLIRIHCEKQEGLVVKMLSKIEKLHLSIINSSVLPFGNYAMDITIVAQMDEEFSLTVKDLVRNLRSALL